MKSNKTNPIGTGTENLCVNLPKVLKKGLEEMAARNGMKIGEYCRYILSDAVDKGIDIKVKTEVMLVRSNGK